MTSDQQVGSSNLRARHTTERLEGGFASEMNVTQYRDAWR
jgi:hypothetical protein